jgi:hypothetical protein
VYKLVLSDKNSQTETLLTTQRELSLQEENIQFIGLDHPLVAARHAYASPRPAA